MNILALCSRTKFVASTNLMYIAQHIFLAFTATTAVGADFVKDVQPILQEHCVRCHGSEEQNGGLRYDQRAAAMAQADSGKRAIVPGDPAQSELLRRITSTHKDEQMPPKGERLMPAEIALLREWIKAGAEWPEDMALHAVAKPQSSHWSFQPIREPQLPEVKDKSWARNEIDVFIQAKREAAGLRAAADAAPHALRRRIAFDLTGLPPRTDALDEPADVEELLSSRAYGERWARHWMDWVRYADTAGDNSDYPIPQAYLYRNYLIESIQADVPYDRFLTEQIAGDLLPAKSQSERNRLTIATGYLAMARRFGSLVERYPWHLTIEDTIDNMGRSMLGLTLSCARCHDHKFDPISMRDYYGLYGIFASTRYPQPGLELFKTQHHLIPLLSEQEVVKKLGPYQKDTDRLEAELERQLALSERKARENTALERTCSIDEQRRMKDELDAMLMSTRRAGEKLAEHLKKVPVIPAAYAVKDAKAVNAHLQMKGEPDHPGAEVPRKFPDVLGGQLLDPAAQKGSGRLQLAEWITSAQNPLTARVIVNRVWQRHFGRGLVPSTSDFGVRGEPPTHPELLDWLALDFIRHGWSLKHLHRRILSSRTYQMSCEDTQEGLARDPGNALYWKFNRLRLDAESLRDALLTISGQLDPKPQSEPYPMPPSASWSYTQHHPFKDDYPSHKRSIYQMTKRLTAKPYLQTFDGADANVCTSIRDSSVTSIQALYLVNDAFVHEQAEHFAKKIIQAATADAQRIEHAFRTSLARSPTIEEKQLLMQHLQSLRGFGHAELASWSSLARSVFRLNEFMYLD
jgi:mono/diheme cytochrome c family protein